MYRVATNAARRAVTLIEAVLFISIALGLIVGGIVFFQQAALTARVNEQTRILSGIVAEARALLKNTGWAPIGLNDQLDDVLVSMQAVPPDIILPAPLVWEPGMATVLRTRWDTALGLQMATGAMFGADPNTNFIRLALMGIPTAACARLAVVDASGQSTYTSGLSGIGMQGAGGAQNLVPPVSPSDAASNCAAAAGNATNVGLHLWFFADRS